VSRACDLVSLLLCSGALAACGGAGEQWAQPASAPQTAQGVIPVSIGAGPEFVPAARAPATACTAGGVFGRRRAHVELFAHRRAIVIPTGIGVGAPDKRVNGRIVAARCRAATRTLDPSGVVDFDHDGLTLRDLFETWGEPLGAHRLLSFTGAVEVFVGGERVDTPAADVALSDGAQIVVELGGYVPPHRSFLFPPRG
jgi:hypothetical protein